MPIDQLDFQAVAKADERFWAKHPELHKRALTSDRSDAGYRSEWLKLYQQAEQESTIPAPTVVPKPAPPPPPINATSPVQDCLDVAMTHEQKMEAAIHSANLGEDVLRELGDIKTLVATMVIVGGGLALAGVAAAATGVGLLVEGVAAVGAGLLVAGAAMSGWQIGQGLSSLYDFFQQTRCDTATTPQELHQAGKKFGEGVAKVGIGTINLLLSLLGGRGKDWRGRPISKITPSVFDELAARRKARKLPPAGSPKDKSTLAKLKIAGKEFEGINSGDQNPRTKITIKRLNNQTKTHAEAESVQKAIDEGMKGKARTAEMWIDREPCDSCGIYNGLGSLARELGVEELIVHYPKDGQIVTQTFKPVR